MVTWTKKSASVKQPLDWNIMPERRTAPPTPASTIPPVYPLSGASEAVRGSDWTIITGNNRADWTGDVTWTPGGTAIIRGKKVESTYHGLKDTDSD